MPTLQKSEAKSLDEVGARNRPAPGFYHVAIHHWDETMSKRDEVVVEYQVLAGTTPGQEGKVHRESIGLKKANGDDNSDNFDANIRRILVSTGLISVGDAIDRDVTEEILGRQCVVELSEREYKDKDGKDKKATNIANFGRGVYPIGHPEVAHVPLNRGALALLAGKQNVPPVTNQATANVAPQQQQVAAQPAQSPPAAAAAGSAWSSV